MKTTTFTILALVLVLPFAATTSARVSAQQAPIPAQLPMKFTARPTVAAITPQDLMSRLYVFADDSMMGRAAGTIYNDRGTNYIAGQLAKLGLKPAGDDGTFFQSAHLFTRALDTTSTVTVDGKTYVAGADFLASIPTVYNPLSGTISNVVYGGFANDTSNVLPPEAVAGKILLLGPTVPGFKGFATQEEVNAWVATNGYKNYIKMVRSAAATMSISPTAFAPQRIASAFHPQAVPGLIRVPLLGAKPANPGITLSPQLADVVLGTPFANAAKGTVGKPITYDIKFTDTALPGRNVVAILPGSDPKLKNEYVAIGGHNDHIPLRSRPVDHDSMRAFLGVVQTGGAEGPFLSGAQITPEMWARVNAVKDSLRQVHGGAIRMDSINNGADDDGTGSMGVLEIAEAFAKAPMAQRPKRSIIFVWHVGEELNMFGSNYFTDHPTVPRDSIVAQLNVDMIGRGGPADPVPWGGPTYLQLIGSHRLSTELGDIVEKVNTDTKAGFKYDYQFDANGDSHNYYCRSDHWAYARYGIPIAFFTTGGHRDYHQVTDEPEYIDYTHYAHVAQLIHDIAVNVANLDHRPVVDGKKGDPYGSCQQ